MFTPTQKRTGRPIKFLLAGAASALLLASGTSYAAYPDKAVTWVIPFPPGGPTDVSSRILADAFSKELGQTFVTENKAGASGTIGIRTVVQDKSDGYTIGTLAAPSLIAPFMMAQAPYDLTKDVTPIGVAYETPLILVVNPGLLPDVTDLKSLAEAAKKMDMNYTTAGVGSTAHLNVELIKKELGFEAMHIPYQGSAPAVTAVLAGDVPMMFSDSVAVLPHIQAGTLRAIAVNKDDFAALPDVKSLAQQGLTSSKAISWSGILAPAGISAETRDKLSATLEKVLNDPIVSQRLQSAGAYPLYSTSQEMAERLATDSKIWKTVIEENGIKSQ